MTADFQELIFAPDGTLSFIFSDDLAVVARAIVQDGRLEIRRASDVEPTPDGQWSAIMRPWAGGADLGVFSTRALALTAEVEHLRMVMGASESRGRPARCPRCGHRSHASACTAEVREAASTFDSDHDFAGVCGCEGQAEDDE